MPRHPAKRRHWARRAFVAAALPIAIAAASTGTAHAQPTGSDTGSLWIPPWWPGANQVDPFKVLAPNYNPTPEQRIADYTDTGEFVGGVGGLAGGGSLVSTVAGAVIMPAFVAAPVVMMGPLAGAIFVGGLAGAAAGGSVGANAGAQSSADLANQHNATGQRNPLS
ncbi:hypothetical protein [Rhodococcus xishaensis]|uniref:Uncharacterized protein n=1 Tax=Rhodococcus xishaensis TaxID=2487364 RepID=A0A438B037_9NOCA|nr:hypothetical protein [Rhodococcus xishaensis]RVW04248.1 hypothetical protein EGT50_07270 [Rhodococcus xishaensis]